MRYKFREGGLAKQGNQDFMSGCTNIGHLELAAFWCPENNNSKYENGQRWLFQGSDLLVPIPEIYPTLIP